MQEVAPPEPKRVDAPPAAKAPEMVDADPKLRPDAAHAGKVEEAGATRPRAGSRRTGAEVKAGEARATRARRDPFGGLATGGGGTGGVR